MSEPAPNDKEIYDLLRVRHLSERGMGECAGCKKVTQLVQALVVTWHSSVVLVRCDACAADHDLVVRNVARGLEVRLENRRPSLVLTDAMCVRGPSE